MAAKVIDNGVAVEWDDGVITEHHRFVLRENSPEATTTHPVSREQQVQLTELPVDLRIVKAKPDDAGGLTVWWSQHGDHGGPGSLDTSTFHPGWLRAWAREADETPALPPQRVWDAHFDLSSATFDGTALRDRGAVFDKWLTSLRTHGLGLVTGLGAHEDVVTDLASMIGPVRTTNFGHVFDVQTKAVDVTSNAYTDLELPVHTDLDTREYMPGLQFLHCMVSDASGGETRLSDAAAITAHLHAEHRDAWEALTTIPVCFINKAVDTDYRHTSPFLVVDDDGTFVEARWSPWLRGPLQASIENAERFYAALRLALTLGDDPDFVVRVRLQPGDVIAFDNRRVLHGRGSIDRATGTRWLRGCYVEREELDSRLRVLARTSAAAR